MIPKIIALVCSDEGDGLALSVLGCESDWEMLAKGGVDDVDT